jgi:hypothetical protein
MLRLISLRPSPPLNPEDQALPLASLCGGRVQSPAQCVILTISQTKVTLENLLKTRGTDGRQTMGDEAAHGVSIPEHSIARRPGSPKSNACGIDKSIGVSARNFASRPVSRVLYGVDLAGHA